jgi:hypothetical protein
MAPTAWENATIAHARLFQKTGKKQISLNYRKLAIKLDHIKKMTTDFAMIQFSKMYYPDIDSGYRLDDNARIIIAPCMHFDLTGDKADVKYIGIYLGFINHCLQTDWCFLNYVNKQWVFTAPSILLVLSSRVASFNNSTVLSSAGGKTGYFFLSTQNSLLLLL